MKLVIDGQRLNKDVQKVNGALRRFATLSGRDIAVETKHSARRTAANLAYRTQPFGDSAQQQEVGQKTVHRDIHRVFTTPGKLFESVEQQHNKPGLANHFYALAKAGKVGPVRKLLASLGMSLPIGQTPKRDLHRSRRDGRGRVSKGSPSQLVLGGKAGDSLARYVAKIQKKVGWAASGWSACAARLGGTRGIVKWKKRGSRGPGAVYSTGGDQKPTHYLMNHAPYIRNICTVYDIRKALRREEVTLRQQTQIVLKKSAKRSGLRVG